MSCFDIISAKSQEKERRDRIIIGERWMPLSPMIFLDHPCPSSFTYKHLLSSYCSSLHRLPFKMFYDLPPKQTSVLDSSCCPLTSKPLFYAQEYDIAWRALCPLVMNEASVSPAVELVGFVARLQGLQADRRECDWRQDQRGAGPAHRDLPRLAHARSS